VRTLQFLIHIKPVVIPPSSSCIPTPQIRGVGPQSMIEMANCQLSISCAYICSHLTIGYVHLQVGACV
jgi:hypothetical protein